MKKYGYPYMWSKSKIAEDIISFLPDAENFYDLFAWWCAITHCALESGKYKNIIANDIQGSVELFVDASNGKYKNEFQWVSREDFHRLKSTNPYIRWIWSFGNNWEDYLFGKKIEPIKKEAHEYLFTNWYDYSSKKRVGLIKQFKEEKMLEGRFQLQQLQQLEQLERLEQLEQLEHYKKDYREIDIKPNSIVYCDIPYNQKEVKDTEYYWLEFNTKDFYEWAKTRDFPVYFSSVYCSDSFFTEVWSKEKQSLMWNKWSTWKKVIIEKIYWNNK